MFHRHLLLGLIPLTAALSSCSMFSSSQSDLADLDELIAKIERVHVETELAKAKSQAALGQLRTITAPEFQGDVLAAFAQLEAAVTQSQDQGEKLRTSVSEMRGTAEPLFDRWRGNLLSFTNPQMRQRSQARLEETKANYQAILTAVEPAQSTLDALNLGLRDVALFLSNDFNTASLTAVDPDVRNLTNLGAELDARLNASLDAALAYVDRNALPNEPGDPQSGAQMQLETGAPATPYR